MQPTFTLRSCNGEYFVFKNVDLHNHFRILGIQVSAKQIKPTTGLRRLTQQHGSCILASPKQFLEFVPASGVKAKYPHAITTPGAVTVADYESEKYMSKRTSFIAESDHMLGGVIVEIESSKYFHFRHVQAHADGSFVDFGVQYNPDNTIKPVEEVNLVLGDWHAGQTNKALKRSLASFPIPITNIILHDFFDGKSVSHHDERVPMQRAMNYLTNQYSLREELKIGAKDIAYLKAVCSNSLIFVKGNHDEFLDRYLQQGRYIQDHVNHYDSLMLAKALFDGESPLKVGYEMYGGAKLDRTVWLDRESEYVIGDVECGQHGDLGPNGSRGSLNTSEYTLGPSVTGHTHSGGIQRRAFRVGTSTDLKLDYNRGPSSWTHTSALVYNTGAVQLINFINNKWKL